MQVIPIIVVTHAYFSHDDIERLQQALAVGMTSVSLQWCLWRWHFKHFCPIIQETGHYVAIFSISSGIFFHPLCQCIAPALWLRRKPKKSKAEAIVHLKAA